MTAAVLLGLAAHAWAAASPSPHLNWDRPAQEIAAHCRQAKSRAESKLREVASLSAVSRTFANTPAAFDDALWTLFAETASDQFAKHVHVSSAARAAGNGCETLIRQFALDVYAREDLYKAITAYAANKEKLGGEDERLLRFQLRRFKRAGMGLEAGRRFSLLALRREIVALEADFSANLNEVSDYLLLSRDALAGLPDDYVARLAREGDRYKVTTDYPDYLPFMKNAKDPDARRRLQTLFDGAAAGKNLPILKRVLALRAEAARLLGYPSHAAFVLEERMAKDPAAVSRFLDRLVKRLRPLARQELAELVRLKDAEEGTKSDHVIHDYDWLYYDNQRLKSLSVDKERIKEYFPLETVLAGMFEIYQKLFGVRFRRVEDARVWHPDVQLYEVGDSLSGETVAWFYLDLYPREGKYKHAMAAGLLDSRRLADGSYQKPVAALVANFQKPAPGRPSLLRHGAREEVETLFHEFGHVMHQTLSRTKYGRFAGASGMGDGSSDFVEAPPQMLENWTWDRAMLEKISGRYDAPSEKLPAELAESLRAAKRANVGLSTLRQLALASADLAFHTRSSVSDTTALMADVMMDVMMVPLTPGTHPDARFRHVMSGYDAGYYGYLWSEVYAADMFSKFEDEGLLDPVLGRRYRAEVLESGASRDEAESLRRFLGRPPSDAAFLKQLGLSP